MCFLIGTFTEVVVAANSRQLVSLIICFVLSISYLSRPSKNGF